MNIRWVLLPLLLPLAGCNQYWERNDSINTEFGNAVSREHGDPDGRSMASSRAEHAIPL